jgi:hypothetical protein
MKRGKTDTTSNIRTELRENILGPINFPIAQTVLILVCRRRPISQNAH